MNSDDTDRDWELFGQTDPYWAVITHDQYRKENLTDAAVEQFYQVGEDWIGWVFETIRTHVDDQFSPASALDFGCGLGRLTLATAKRCRSVVGVDVSSAMLEKAQSRRDQLGVQHVSFVKGDDSLSAVTGSFDLVTSFIVFQHIPCDRGERLFCRLLELLTDGGVGVLHLTYSKAWYDPLGMCQPPSGLRYHLSSALRLFRDRYLPAFRRRNGKDNQAPNGGPAAPVMQMNDYNLNRLCHFIQKAGAHRMHAEFTDHGGHYGVVFFFQKRTNDPYRA
jgi:SAM-dependent methyltransferase